MKKVLSSNNQPTRASGKQKGFHDEMPDHFNQQMLNQELDGQIQRKSTITGGPHSRIINTTTTAATKSRTGMTNVQPGPAAKKMQFGDKSPQVLSNQGLNSMHRKNKKSHYVVSDTQMMNQYQPNPQVSKKVARPSGLKHTKNQQSEIYNSSSRIGVVFKGDTQAESIAYQNLQGSNGGLQQQYPRTQVNSNLQSINSSTQNIHAVSTNENLQQKINKKRIQSSGMISKNMVSIPNQGSKPGHQRIQSNPTYYAGYNNGQDPFLAQANVRSQPHISNQGSGENTSPQYEATHNIETQEALERVSAQKPMVLPKTSNSSKRGPAPMMKQTGNKAKMSSIIDGNKDPKLLDKALNTIFVSDGQNMSRQEGVGADQHLVNKLAQKMPKGKTSATMQQQISKKMNTTSSQYNQRTEGTQYINQGIGVSPNLQKTFNKDYQGLSFDKDPNNVKTMMVPNPQAQNLIGSVNNRFNNPQQNNKISQSHAQSSPKSAVVSPIIKKQQDPSFQMQKNGQSNMMINHRRNLSDQVQMPKQGQKFLQQTKSGHHRAQTGSSYQMDEIGAQIDQGRIVVINNNNTNINIHHQGSFPSSQMQSYHQYQGTQNMQNLPANQVSQTFQQPKTNPNQSIRSSFNNSLVGHNRDHSAGGYNYLNDVMNPKVYENGATSGQSSQQQSRKIIQKAKLDTWVKGPRDQIMAQGGLSSIQSNDQEQYNRTQKNRGPSSQNASAFRGNLQQNRGASRGKQNSIVMQVQGQQNKGTKDQKFTKSTNQISGNGGNQSGLSSKQQLRRTIKNLSLSSNKQIQLKQHQGDRGSSNMFLSSERSSGVASKNHHENKQEGYYQSSSTAKLAGQKVYQGYNQQQQFQGKITEQQVDGMYLIKQQQNNFVASTQQQKQQAQGSKNTTKHQKKPSAGTTLTKGQKQLRQILNSQAQASNLSSSPSKKSFEMGMHQAPQNLVTDNSRHLINNLESELAAPPRYGQQNQKTNSQQYNQRVSQQANSGNVQHSPYDTKVRTNKLSSNFKVSSQNSNGAKSKKTENYSEHMGITSQEQSLYQDPIREAYSQPESPSRTAFSGKNKRGLVKQSTLEQQTYSDPTRKQNLSKQSERAKIQKNHQVMMKHTSKPKEKISFTGHQQIRGDCSAAGSTNTIDENPRTQIYNNILKNIRNQDLDTKIEYYKIGKVIGKGAFGKVNLAIHRLTGKFVALKSISRQMMSDESSLKKVRQEYNILKKAKHQNIVRLYESFDTEQHIVYVMEVCGGGDLLTYVRRRRKLKEDYAKFLFRQIILGLHYIHAKGVLHRDIKLDNILLTSEGDVKICDFGVSKQIQSRSQLQTEQCGTPAYIAPEVFRGKGYRGFQSDIWSAGVVLYAMLYGTVPFKATNMHELQAQIINVQCSWGQTGDITPQALEMLQKILEPDPNKRLTPEQILVHPWMQLTEQQIKQVEVFSQYEKEKIVSEFEYYNQKKENVDGNVDDPFLEQMLVTTQNSVFKNNTTKSVILAPFNSTKSHISDNFYLNESIQDLLASKDVVVFADKCREVNRQYMLNNNAELDNGVYNENDDEAEEKKEAKDDGLVDVNLNLDQMAPAPIGENEGPSSYPASYPQSNAQSNLQSLNTSQVMVDEDKVDELHEKYGYQHQYVIDSIENDDLNHATSTYFLIDLEKAF